MIKLDIGSGGKSSDSSFLGVDYYTDADIKALMWDLPFDDNSVDVIFSSQALEHVSKFMVVPTLREWNRVLKPLGRLQLQVPDLEWACRYWLETQSTDWPLDIIYGNQKHEGEFHKTGFTPAILVMYFDVAGGYTIHKIEFFGGVEQPMPDDFVRVTQRWINLEAEKKE